MSNLESDFRWELTWWMVVQIHLAKWYVTKVAKPVHVPAYSLEETTSVIMPSNFQA